MTRRLPGDALDRLAAEADSSTSGPAICRRRTTSSRDATADADGADLPAHRPHRCRADRRRPAAARDQPDGRRIRQHRRCSRDRAAASRSGNTPGVLTEATADLDVRADPRRRAAHRRGGALRARRALADVGPVGLLGLELHGATLGIVGFGKIGQAVARRAQGFGMEVLCSRTASPVPDGRLGRQVALRGSCCGHRTS